MKEINDHIDELEVVMLKSDNLVDCKLNHEFTPGVYSRTIYVPADTLITSMVHKEEHQYIISLGSAAVKIGEDQWNYVYAHHKGVTKAGTRRVFYTEEGCIWTTVHATNIFPKDSSKEALAEAVELVEDQIFEKRENPLLGGYLKNNKLIKILKSCQE